GERLLCEIVGLLGITDDQRESPNQPVAMGSVGRVQGGAGAVDVGAVGCQSTPSHRGVTSEAGRLLQPARDHIRKTPNFVSRIGAWRAASRPMASTRRVSSGSMIPSS